MSSPETTDASARRRTWPRRLALTLVSLTVSLLVLEVVATLWLGGRFVRGAQLGNTWKIAGRLDPELGWSGRPGARGRIVHGEMDYTVRLNSRGFRDPERALAKRPGLRRVLALGDSVTWGWGVQQGERFTDLLEEQLGPDLEVLNLACPGYGTDQQYWTLVVRGLDYDPDVVLLCVVINDILEAQQARFYDMDKPRFARAADGTWRVEGRPVAVEAGTAGGVGAWERLVTHSALLSLVTRRPLGRAPDAPRVEANHGRPTPEMIARIHAVADELIDPGSASRHALTLLRDVCAARGVPLLVTAVPHKHDQFLYEPRFPAPEDLGPAPFRTYFTRRLEQACAELGLPVAPVDDAFLEVCRAGTSLHVGDGHPNAAGHRLIAERLEPALRALLEE